MKKLQESEGTAEDIAWIRLEAGPIIDIHWMNSFIRELFSGKTKILNENKTNLLFDWPGM